MTKIYVLKQRSPWPLSRILHCLEPQTYYFMLCNDPPSQPNSSLALVTHLWKGILQTVANTMLSFCLACFGGALNSYPTPGNLTPGNPSPAHWTAPFIIFNPSPVGSWIPWSVRSSPYLSPATLSSICVSWCVLHVLGRVCRICGSLSLSLSLSLSFSHSLPLQPHCSVFCLLHCSVDQFCTTPGGC